MAQWQGPPGRCGLLVAAALNVLSPRTSKDCGGTLPPSHASATLPRLPCRGFLFGIQL